MEGHYHDALGKYDYCLDPECERKRISRREARAIQIASIKAPIEFDPGWAGPGFNTRNDESTT